MAIFKKYSTGLLLGLTVILGLVSSGNCFAQAGQCIIVSDIHLNPFFTNDGKYDVDTALMSKLAAMPVDQWDAFLRDDNQKVKLGADIRNGHRDSNYSLLMMAIDSMHARLPNPAFILIAGDFVWHLAELKNVTLKEKDIAFIAWEFHQRFDKTIPIIPALGNNDSDEHNELQTRGFLKAFAEAWLPNNKQMYDDETFRNYGYYAYHFSKLTIIVLNSAPVYSAAHKNYDTVATRMFSWLNTELNADQNNIWMIWHVPPGKNAFDRSDFWKGDYSNQFYKIITNNSPKIKFCVASHTHFNEYKVVCDSLNNPVASIHLVPSIGMDHGNNPSFEIADFDAGFNVTKEVSYYLDLDGSMQWKPLPGPEGLNPYMPHSLLSYVKRYTVNTRLTPIDYSIFFSVHTSAGGPDSNYFNDDILKVSNVTPEGRTARPEKKN